MTTVGYSMSINRRAVLATSLAAGVVGGSAKATATPLSPADSRGLYRRMRYRTDSGLVFAWIKGPFMAVIGADVTPLFELNLGAVQRITQRPDGGFAVRDFEIAFLADLETGKRLTAFKNPITGEVVPVELERPRPYQVVYTADDALIAPDLPGGVRLDMRHAPVSVLVEGGEVFIRDRTRTVVTAPGQPQRILNEISTLSAPKTVALDPAVACVKARIQSNDVTSWEAWLKMGARPGVMALYGFGAKVDGLADMPADWTEMLHEVWPDIAADPVAVLDRTP